MAQEAELAIERDERFDRAGPHLFLGILHLRTEGKPFVGFGDLDQALRHLARAVELFPQAGENRVAYAEALIADEMYPQAREQLAAAVAAPAPPDLEEKREEWLAKAAELEKQIPGS
jgi:tetratricopeptide (TPR) repeat protein